MFQPPGANQCVGRARVWGQLLNVLRMSYIEMGSTRSSHEVKGVSPLGDEIWKFCFRRFGVAWDLLLVPSGLAWLPHLLWGWEQCHLVVSALHELSPLTRLSWCRI